MIFFSFYDTLSLTTLIQIILTGFNIYLQVHLRQAALSAIRARSMRMTIKKALINSHLNWIPYLVERFSRTAT